MPAIRCRAPSALRGGGLGGLLRTDITRWSAPAVSCVGRRKASGVRSGGAPVRQLVYLVRRGCGPGFDGPAPVRLVAAGRGAFFKRARGWVSIPTREAGYVVSSIERTVDC